MFDFLKSTKALEEDLRDWLGIERARQSSGDMEIARQVLDMSTEMIVMEAAASAKTLDAQIKHNRAFGQPTHGLRVSLHCASGFMRLDALLKRKKWTLRYHGAPAIGYTCEIIELTRSERDPRPSS